MGQPGLLPELLGQRTHGMHTIALPSHSISQRTVLVVLNCSIPTSGLMPLPRSPKVSFPYNIRLRPEVQNHL